MEGHLNLEFPVSLDAVLAVSLDFDNLKVNLEFLLNLLKGHDGLLRQFQEKFNNLSSDSRSQTLESLYEKLRQKVKKRKREVTQERTKNEEQDKVIQDLLNRLKAQEGLVSQLQAKQGAHTEAINRHETAVSDHESRLQSLEGGSGDGNALGMRVEQLERKAQESEIRTDNLEGKSAEQEKSLKAVSESASRSESKCKALDTQVSDLSSRISDLESALQATDSRSLENQANIEMLKKLLKQLEEAIRDKADADAFDQLRGVVSAISSKSGNAGSGPAPMISSKDMNLIKELDRRVSTLEENASKQSSGRTAEILQRLELVERDLKLKANLDDLEAIRALLNKLRADIERLEKWLQDLEDRPAAGQTSDQGGSRVDNTKLTRLIRRVDVIEEALKALEGFDPNKIYSEIHRLWEAVEELKAALERLRKEMNDRFRDLEALIGRKVDSSVLAELESNIHTEKLEETIKALTDSMPKRFAEKSETKKALQSLESRIHALLEVSGGLRDGEDAMIARKPLGGWSCLSCEKALEKLKGRMAGYQPWNKMPRRDPADRIARVGPGFSKMLATFQPELLSSRSRQQGQRRVSPHDHSEPLDEDQDNLQLPRVKGHEQRPFTAAVIP